MAHSTPTSIIDRDQMPDRAKIAYDLCEQFAFKPYFTFEYPTPADHQKRIQVRSEKHVAPGVEVQKYAAQMKAGEKFAPIIVTEDDFLVDGATRADASRKNKSPYIHALVLNIKREKATNKEMQRLVGLGAAFNLRNGKGIDRAEIRNAVELIGKNPDYNATRIAVLLGCTEGTVVAILAEKRARDRAELLGISLNGELSANVLRALGRADKSINDDPLRELLKLVIDAGLTQKEINAIIKAMKEAKSDAGALNVIKAEREARKDQIAEHKVTGRRAKTPFPSQLRQHLGFVLRFARSSEDLVEHSPNLRVDHLQRIESAADILQELIEKQGTLNAS